MKPLRGKVAVSIITECLEAQLRAQRSKPCASILYPAGGRLAAGIWTCDRNRPVELAREQAFAGAPDLRHGLGL